MKPNPKWQTARRIAAAYLATLALLITPGCATSMLWNLDEGSLETARSEEETPQATVHRNAAGELFYTDGKRQLLVTSSLAYGPEAIALLTQPELFVCEHRGLSLSISHWPDGNTTAIGRMELRGTFGTGWGTEITAAALPAAVATAVALEPSPAPAPAELAPALAKTAQVAHGLALPLLLPDTTSRAHISAFAFADDTGRLPPPPATAIQPAVITPYPERAAALRPWRLYLRITDGDRSRYLRTDPAKIWLLAMTSTADGKATYRTNLVGTEASAGMDLAPVSEPVTLPVRLRTHWLQHRHTGIPERIAQVTLTPAAVAFDAIAWLPTQVLLLFADW